MKTVLIYRELPAYTCAFCFGMYAVFCPSFMTDLSSVQLCLLLFSFRCLGADLTKLINELYSYWQHKEMKWVFSSPWRCLKAPQYCFSYTYSLHCALIWVAKDPRFLHADSEDWSNWIDAQAGSGSSLATWDILLVCSAPFCWFCSAPAQMFFYYYYFRNYGFDSSKRRRGKAQI